MGRRVSAKQLFARYGKDRTLGSYRVYLWRGVREGRLPAPIQEGPNSIAWDEDEFEAAMRAMPRATYGRKKQAA